MSDAHKAFMSTTTARPVGAFFALLFNTSRFQPHAAATRVLTLLGTSCSDAATAPQTGGIQASVRITGGEPSESTYALIVDSLTQTFAFGASQVIRGLSAGSHTLTLKVPAKNCTVTGLDRMSITVRPGATADVTFEVECKTTGIEITTHTTGLDIPSDYAALVNGEPRTAEPNGLLLVSRLEPGPNTVTLTALGDNCHVVGANPITVDVVNRAVTPIEFDVVCVRIERPEKIAYEARNTTSSWGDTIRLMNPDGSGDIELGSGTAPSWSPDGSKLAFFTLVCTPYFGCYQGGSLAVMDADGRNIQALTAAIGGSPAWAPSGDVIAFVGCCDSLPQLYLTRLDGSTPMKLPIQGVDGADHRAWSPDGLRIAFQCFFARGATDVCIVNRDGTGLVRLMTADFPLPVDYRPAWSPDGRSIACTWGTVEAQIAVMAGDGSSSLRLITGGAQPAWSRDGAKLAFVRDDGLFEINADGSNLKRVTTGHPIAPVWRP
jgi:hypothetical protein